MAKNIAEHVAKEALAYAYAREDEIIRLKRRLEALVENVPECNKCGRSYNDRDGGRPESIIPKGECPFCSMYTHCQGCIPRSCFVCQKRICNNCCDFCAICDSFEEELLCIACSGGTVCFGCIVEVNECIVGCPEHPLMNVTLLNGYRVPSCSKCADWLVDLVDVDAKLEDAGLDMIQFFGMIHRRQKRFTQSLPFSAAEQ